MNAGYDKLVERLCVRIVTLNLSTNGNSGGTWTSNHPAICIMLDAVSGVVTGTGAGSATITYSLTNNGCGTATATQVVTVNDLPTAGTMNSPLYVRV